MFAYTAISYHIQQTLVEKSKITEKIFSLFCLVEHLSYDLSLV